MAKAKPYRTPWLNRYLGPAPRSIPWSSLVLAPFVLPISGVIYQYNTMLGIAIGLLLIWILGLLLQDHFKTMEDAVAARQIRGWEKLVKHGKTSKSPDISNRPLHTGNTTQAQRHTTKRSATLLILSWTPLMLIMWLSLKDAPILVGLAGSIISAIPFSIWWLHRKHANQIKVCGFDAKPFHEGEKGVIRIWTHNKNTHSIHDVGVQIFEQDRHSLSISSQELPADKTVAFQISTPVGHFKRGRHHMDRATLHTGFPFNFFTTYQHAYFNEDIVVYPAIEDNAPAWPLSQHELKKSRAGEDVVGLRPYQRGDAMRMIDWKQTAKHSNLVVREYERPTHNSLMFNWDDVAHLGTEHALQRLTAWVMRAHTQGYTYGLNMPGQQIASAQGHAHLTQCLTYLALFQTQDQAA